MQRSLLFGLLLLFFHVSSAQIVEIIDAQTAQPLEFVIIQSHSPKAMTSSNSEGKASMENFKSSSRIQFHLIGYMPAIRSYAELQEAGMKVKLMADPTSLNQAVVSASRWIQPKKEVPARIALISSRDIAFQNPQTTADLLGNSGEVFIQKSQQGGGSPMIRGFSTNRLLISVDGVRMNTAIFRTGNVQNVISIDPMAVQSAEVFFGPGSVIYGSDAIGGVMSFQTLSPQFSLSEKPFVQGNSALRYSSASNERSMHFDVNVGWQKWAALSSISFTDFDDLRMGSHGPDEYLRHFYVQRQNGTDVVVRNDDPQIQKPTGYSQVNMMQKIRFRPNTQWDLNYALHYSTTTDYSRYDRLIRTNNGLPGSAEWNYGPQKWLMHHLNATYYGKSFLFDQLAVNLAYQKFEESRISRNFNSDKRTIQQEEVDAWSASLDMEKDLGARHLIYYGLEAVYNDVNSRGVMENISTGSREITKARYPISQWYSLAAYLSHQWKFSEKLLLQSGARYSQFMLDADFNNNLAFYPFPFSEANINDGALTASLGLAWHPADSWQFSTNASTGFRSPNVDDVGKLFDSGDSLLVIPNPQLTAEYAYNVEGSITKTIANRIKLEFTAFYTYLDNALVRRPTTLNGQDSVMYNSELSQVTSLQNAAFTEVYGIQAGITIALRNGWGFSSRYNFQKGVDELDDGSRSPSRHAAPAFGLSHLTYELPRLKMDFYAQYSAGFSYEQLAFDEREKPYLYVSDGKGKHYSPAWYTLNFKAQYKITEKLMLGAGVENILDRRYQPYSSGIVAAGRNLMFSLRSSF